MAITRDGQITCGACLTWLGSTCPGDVCTFAEYYFLALYTLSSILFIHRMLTYRRLIQRNLLDDERIHRYKLNVLLGFGTPLIVGARGF